ncbi:hypothetical protein VD0002_g10174 [Verticillium dahliae]|uniref:Uncharacterized protein n=2 Tax=Verticillium dahliae TaxID=27337 RepID=G2XJK9_VERDV|nr:uncharacterized protein VDAG_10341 [Verticillium dahliae VdLs.17]KAH6705632.1 hypothetical protein EV126DRAFT_171620 [Verticillium dahliae]EGY20712.1 hypothetical protein VDAG_10341 [Verticillium dahliae VdLs.17]PNH26555.1 hypothetical protein BJF96_g10134 [Verticillium dahliae]PNH39542.1 hypothetical protein VD0003_g10183 [Verticillium dahliae]PNH52489.1 hypothetical protein VD0002_g10174 [Verticillium dahliae]
MVSADGLFQTKLILQKAPLPSVPPELPQPDKRADPVVAGNNGLTAPTLLPPWLVVQFPSTAFSKLWAEMLRKKYKVPGIVGFLLNHPITQNGRELWTAVVPKKQASPPCSVTWASLRCSDNHVARAEHAKSAQL